MNTIKKFLKDENGLELSEYAVAAALITVALVLTFRELGTTINGIIQNLIASIKG